MSQSRASNRAALAVVFALLLVPGLALAQDGSGNQGGLNSLVGLQPVLIYTISNNFTGSFGSNNNGTGGLEDGAVVSSLIVYSNGLAVWNSTEGDDDGLTDDNGVQVAFLSQDQMRELRQGLRRSGAFRASGLGRAQLNNATEDSLIATITVFLNEGNGNRSLAHTSTFFVGDQNTGRTLLLQNFLQSFTNDLFGSDGSGG